MTPDTSDYVKVFGEEAGAASRCLWYSFDMNNGTMVALAFKSNGFKTLR